MNNKIATSQDRNNKLVTVVSRRHDAFTGLLVLTFLSLGFIGILNHEMWGDEIQAWLIARDSSSIRDLFKNLRYESHPGLWHLCLYFISRFTHNPVAMQLFHLILATGVIYIFAKKSPFTKLQKVLFSFGYFPFYEYNVISRSYVLGVLLVFLFCTLYKTRKNSYILLAFILFLLANSSVYGLIITIALGLTLLVECILDKRMLGSLSARKWDLTISLLILISGIVISIIQIIPPSDSSFAVSGLSGGWEFNIKRLPQSILTIWRSYVPIPNFFTYNFWNSNILLGNSKILNVICLLLSLGLFVFSLALFVQKPVVLFLYLSGTLGIFLFTYLKFLGWVRHHGHLFILFVACLWISSYYVTSELSIRSIKSLFPSFYRISVIATDFSKKYSHKFVTVILCIHVAAGTFAFSMDLSSPFSVSKEVARFIQSQHLDDLLIVGSNDYAASTLSGYLDRKIYYPNINRFGSFIVWNMENKRIDSDEELLEKISNLIKQGNSDLLLVLSNEIKGYRPDISVLPLSKFTTESIGTSNENCYLYLIQNRKN